MIDYEKCNTDIKDPFSSYISSNLVWITHFHRAAEFIAVTEGEIYCTINQQKYLLKKNDAVLILPNQIHSFETKGTSEILVMRFLPELANDFFTMYKDKSPSNNHFTIDSLKLKNTPCFFSPENTFELKSIIYKIIGNFCKSSREWYNEKASNELSYRIIEYIENNFTDSCVLKTAAAELNYDYSYVSKEFLELTGMTFMEYLNNRRINHACMLLKTTKLNSTQIAYECGYNNLRTFNRNFFKYTNTVPSEYRNKLPKTAFGNKK